MKVGVTGLTALLAMAAVIFFAGSALAGPIDTDGDGLLDENDNCPTAFNPTQTNSDADPHGDACDNCVSRTNTVQVDSDGDGCGNQCDSDFDQTGIVSGGNLGTIIQCFNTGTVPPAPAVCDCSDPVDNPAGFGVIGGDDLGCAIAQFNNGTPGPSAFANGSTCF